MTGINQGRPEAAIGEPIRLGSNNEFEIEQHPVSDRLIIRDTVNGKVAYVRKERGGQIGGDGVLVKALKEGKPVADDGRTHDTIQAAERAASGWVFVPPGTFNETIDVNTDGLTIQGSGNNSVISPSNNRNGINLYADNFTIKNIKFEPSAGNFVQTATTVNYPSVLNCFVDGEGIVLANVGTGGTGAVVSNVRAINGGRIGVVGWNKSIVTGCYSGNASSDGVKITNFDTYQGDNSIVANSIVTNSSNNGINLDADRCISIGNRVINADNNGIQTSGNNNIIANNRVSDSTNSDIRVFGSGSIFDGNLTGASN